MLTSPSNPKIKLVRVLAKRKRGKRKSSSPSMTIFSPTFNGKTKIQTTAKVFLEKFRERVEIGLLSGRPHWRARYAVTQQTENQLVFASRGIMSSINVGLNKVSLRYDKGLIEYHVTYWGWAIYCVLLGAILGFILILVYFFTDTTGMIDQRPMVVDPMLNREIGFAIFWGSVAFWGFIWPWVLVAIHKRFAEKALNNIIHEVDRGAV